ncbi:MAG: glycosyltransferase family 2 protein [Planctomycetota bacterium]
MTNLPRISAFVITYNEEHNIAQCLQTLDWADEILVVDSFSEDRTTDIAGEYADRIVEHEFEGHVAQTRFAAEHTSHPWIVWLDADERLTDAAITELSTSLNNDSADWAGFAFPRRTRFMNRWITHSGWYPQHKIRFWHRDCGTIRGEEPHPHVDLDGPVKKLEGDILHYSYPNGMRDMVATSTKYAWYAAQSRFNDGRQCSLLSMMFKPPGNFLKKYLLQLGFLDGMPGFAIAAGAAYYRFMREVMMWELEHAPPEDVS